MPAVAASVSHEFLMAEYVALRDEILKRTEIQHQLLSIALVAVGSFLSLGDNVPHFMLLLYPLLATFLAGAWAQNDARIIQMGTYIADRIEAPLGGTGWEHSLRAGRALRGKGGSLSHFTSRGILVGTQLLAMLAFLLQKPPLSNGGIALLVVDALALALTMQLLSSKPFLFSFD